MSDKAIQGRHNMILENRNKLFLTGINEILQFDETQLRMFTELGELRIKGSGLHISDMSVESGELNVEGRINSMTYENNRTKKRTAVFDKLKR
ncbi:MAG: sporulation protein YabP [Ruminococcus sp.]|nr:sporulation protein YabP [Ruminococcus sp.]